MLLTVLYLCGLNINSFISLNVENGCIECDAPEEEKLEMGLCFLITENIKESVLELRAMG